MAKNYQSISASDDKGDIKCPYLKMIQPNTTNIWTFISSCVDNGVSWIMAFIVVFSMSVAQLGFWKALTGHAPDLYRLDQINGVSHQDLYTRYIDGTMTRINDVTDEEGKISLQDLVAIKKWIVAQEGLDTMEQSSKMETGLLFLAAGGDLETKTVVADNVIKFLHSERPSIEMDVNIPRMAKCDKMMVW